MSHKNILVCITHKCPGHGQINARFVGAMNISPEKFQGRPLKIIRRKSLSQQNLATITDDHAIKGVHNSNAYVRKHVLRAVGGSNGYLDIKSRELRAKNGNSGPGTPFLNSQLAKLPPDPSQTIENTYEDVKRQINESIHNILEPFSPKLPARTNSICTKTTAGTRSNDQLTKKSSMRVQRKESQSTHFSAATTAFTGVTGATGASRRMLNRDRHDKRLAKEKFSQGGSWMTRSTEWVMPSPMSTIKLEFDFPKISGSRRQNLPHQTSEKSRASVRRNYTTIGGVCGNKVLERRPSKKTLTTQRSIDFDSDSRLGPEPDKNDSDCEFLNNDFLKADVKSEDHKQSQQKLKQIYQTISPISQRRQIDMTEETVNSNDSKTESVTATLRRRSKIMRKNSFQRMSLALAALDGEVKGAKVAPKSDDQTSLRTNKQE